MSGIRILVVDDEPQMRRALRTMLTALGFDVEVAEDGEAALARIATWDPSAVLLDLMMPGIDGFEVVRDTRTWSQVPIVVLSAHGEEQHKVRALDLGADDYLTKPFGLPELRARLQAVMRRAHVTADASMSVGPIRIDVDRHDVTNDGRPVHLTPTEFDLLRVLAANAGRVMTHRQILKQVWGEYAAHNTQQLRVYINYLRRKLEPDPANPVYIVNEPGIGYRLLPGNPPPPAETGVPPPTTS